MSGNFVFTLNKGFFSFYVLGRFLVFIFRPTLAPSCSIKPDMTVAKVLRRKIADSDLARYKNRDLVSTSRGSSESGIVRRRLRRLANLPAESAHVGD